MCKVLRAGCMGHRYVRARGRFWGVASVPDKVTPLVGCQLSSDLSKCAASLLWMLRDFRIKCSSVVSIYAVVVSPCPRREEALRQQIFFKAHEVELFFGLAEDSSRYSRKRLSNASAPIPAAVIPCQ